MGEMRFSGIFLAATAIAALFVPAAAFADQTDPRLDSLFEALRTGKSADADETVVKIRSIWAQSQSDTVNILFGRAVEAADEGELNLAAALLDHAVGLSPHFAEAYAYRGAIRIQQDDGPGSIADFTRAIELEPRQFEARIALAEIMLAGGDRRGAYGMFQKALEWNPHDDHARERARKLRDALDGQEI